MQLSYISRLICLALCSVGLLQLVLEAIAWTAAPYLLRPSAATNARRAERSLFLVALLARLGPWLVVLGALVPAYVCAEDNLSPEHVGLVPLCGAVCVLGWWLLGCWRVLRAWIATQRCCKLCRYAGTTPDSLPVLLHPGTHPFLAVAGIFRSRILVSRELLTAGRFSAAALDIAFLHESAHAQQRDNLKLVVLSLLPHVPFATRKRPSLEQRWRLAAEIAADEAGAMGGPERSILLAELLVTMARESSRRLPQGMFALLSSAEDLRERVDRLLRPQTTELGSSLETTPSRADLPTRCAFAFGLGTLVALCLLCIKLGHHAAEVLLHVG